MSASQHIAVLLAIFLFIALCALLGYMLKGNRDAKRRYNEMLNHSSAQSTEGTSADRRLGSATEIETGVDETRDFDAADRVRRAGL